MKNVGKTIVTLFTVMFLGTVLFTGNMAQAAETANPIRVSSYKGNTLQVGDRSGLIISGTAQTVTSASPEIVAVENVGGYWVAVAKSDGTAILTATDSHGEASSLTLTVGEPTPSSGQTTAGAPAPVTELDNVRQEIIRLANEVRRKNGAPELTANNALMDAAQTCSDRLYGNGLFGPNDNITREQLAVILWRYAGNPAATNKELHFNDIDEAGNYALDALRWTVENGILNGYGNGRLNPKGLATRSQAAAMLMRNLSDTQK